MRNRRWAVVVAALAVGACGGTDTSGLMIPSGGPEGPAPSGSDAGGDAGAPPSGGSDSGTPPPARDAGPPADAGGGAPDAAAPCYTEAYAPHAALDDLKNGYQPNAWLSASLEAMKRRYPTTGWFILDAEKGDSQLPQFADGSSWAALMQSLMTMVHEETHGYDFDHSPGANAHTYALRDDLVISPTVLQTWPRSDILPLITDDATQQYDQTYLTGEQGTYDLVFLGDEWNAYTNGLAAITAVGDQIDSAISARDGAVAHLLYIELYLRAGRTQHASDYAALEANAAWQKLVRYEWARVHFWDGVAKAFPLLNIATDKIWADVNKPENLDEIKLFTGDDAATVACHP